MKRDRKRERSLSIAEFRVRFQVLDCDNIPFPEANGERGTSVIAITLKYFFTNFTYFFTAETL